MITSTPTGTGSQGDGATGGEHFYGTAPEMDRWEAERVQLVVMCVYESIDTPTVQVSRAQPDPITGNNYNFTYHPNELTLGVPPAIGHERRVKWD